MAFHKPQLLPKMSSQRLLTGLPCIHVFWAGTCVCHTNRLTRPAARWGFKDVSALVDPYLVVSVRDAKGETLEANQASVLHDNIHAVKI
jgi:hypothetical protein